MLCSSNFSIKLSTTGRLFFWHSLIMLALNLSENNFYKTSEYDRLYPDYSLIQIITSYPCTRKFQWREHSVIKVITDASWFRQREPWNQQLWEQERVRSVSPTAQRRLNLPVAGICNSRLGATCEVVRQQRSHTGFNRCSYLC